MNIQAKAMNTDCRAQTRRDIAALNGILSKIGTEDGFEEYCDKDRIAITVGDDTVDLYFAPRTWDAAEQFIMFCICHLIESDGLDEFPYYKEMADRYAAALGEERGTFE